MGGRGSGGSRVGSGRKPKSARERALGGHAGRRTSKSAQVRDRKSVKKTPPALPIPTPPDGMSQRERQVWDRLAPHAVAKRTLTPATAESFKELCEAIELRRAMLEQIEEQGMTFRTDLGQIKAHPLMSQQRSMLQRIEAGRARFRLAPFGKPEDEAEGWGGSGEEPDDEWSDFDEEEATVQ